MKDKGYIQIYTGNGKGKTTAALGLCLRGVCAGKKIFFGQFLKGIKYSELDAVKFMPNFTIEQFGRNSFIYKVSTSEDIEMAQKGLIRSKEIISSGKYDIVVLDELNIALYYKLITINDALELMSLKPEHVELIITGRNAKEELINKADLVTEMVEIKHYYTQGVEGRIGIEK